MFIKKKKFNALIDSLMKRIYTLEFDISEMTDSRNAWESLVKRNREEMRKLKHREENLNKKLVLLVEANRQSYASLGLVREILEEAYRSPIYEE